MQIGSLEDIAFQVSSNIIQTFDNLKWSGSARYNEHKRHMTNALTEFTGIDADTISFDINLSSFLGADPMSELIKIWTYERNGTALTLVIGEKIYGKYKWTIKAHKIKFETYDKNGNMTSASVSIDLIEYLKS